MQRSRAAGARLIAFFGAWSLGFSCAVLPAQQPVTAASPEAVPLVDDEGMIDDSDPTVGDSGIDDSDPNAAMTLESLQSIALASNPSIARAEALLAAARGRALQVGLRPNPEVGIDFQQLGSSGLAEQYGVAVRQEIVRRRKLQLNRSIELHRVDRLQEELSAARQRVLTDVRIAYFRALRAERQIELTSELVRLAEKGLEISNELLKAQEVGRTDVLQAELEVEVASILFQNARNRRRAVWQQLSAVTGQPLEPQRLVGDIADDGFDIIYEEALARLQESSPEIAAIFADIRRAQCNLSRQQIETLPDVTVEGLINWRDNGVFGDSNGGIAVSLPLPIVNRNQGGIREARYQLAAAQRELGQTELSLQQRLAPVFQRYQNAKEQVQRYRDRILPKSAETLDLTRQIYELGEINFINLLTVQRTYATNQLAYLDALEALHTAEAEIMGLLLTGSLNLNRRQ